MDEGANSWIRRTKFTTAVYHRVDSIPFPIQFERNPGLTCRPEAASSSSNRLLSTSSNTQVELNPSKQRSVSPLPQTVLSDSFKEARSERKRFSTPNSRRKESEKRIMGKESNNNGRETKDPKQKVFLKNNPLKQFAAMKINDKTKNKKESAWTKYFDHGGGRVTALDVADEWEVDLSKLFLGQKFAHGANSTLYRGIYKDEAVAVKIIRIPDDDENGALTARLENQFTREVNVLSQLHHRNVVKFIAACRKPPVFFIVAEYIPEGSLRAYLHKLEKKSLPLQKLISIALDIARGMEFIHSQGVIHRDLKPENVLIDQGFHLKIADFGIACEEAYCDVFADDPGTFRWMAPEMIRHKSYGRKVDVYSFGLILWEMVAGSIPYVDMSPIQAAFAVVNKNLRPTIPNDCPPAMKALIEQCWSLQPEKRPEFWQVVKVLEEFESSLARDGTLSLVQNTTCQDHKKGLLRWIQKLAPVQTKNSSIPKLRLT